MTSPFPLRRLLLGALITGAAVTTTPSIASAASTCSLNTLGQVNVFDDTRGESQLQIRRSGQLIGIADDRGAPLRFCPGATGPADVFNTNQVIVHEKFGAAAGGIRVDQSGGMLVPGAAVESDGVNEIEVLVLGDPGTLPNLTVTGTPGADTMKVTSGGGVMIGTDSDVDVRARSANRVQVDGASGNDFISARGNFPDTTRPASNLRVDLLGSLGDDTLVDGASDRDDLFGGGGNDTLFAVDNRPDDLAGGTGFDRATVDAADLVTDVEQTTLGTIGKLRLAPAVVRAKAGGVAHMKLSWRHPRSWKQLRRIAVRLYDGTTLVKRVVVRPRRAEHHGRTVSAKLALRLPRRLAGRDLRVDVEATDRHGRRQLEPSAGLVHL